MICLKCDKPLETDSNGNCRLCKWENGETLSEQSERFPVFASVVYRAIENGTQDAEHICKIKVSDREFALLNEGDQCQIDEAKWYLQEKITDTQTLHLKGFTVVRLPTHQYFEFGFDDPKDEIKRELIRWRDLRLAIDEMRLLKSQGKLLSYLGKTEKQRNHHRSYVQDQSPYYNM